MDIFCLPKYIKKEEFSGILSVYYDRDDNCIRFWFLFDKPEMKHPLVITIKAIPIRQDEKNIEVITYAFACDMPDCNKLVLTTGFRYPEFWLKEHKIVDICIESQVTCQFFEIT